MFVVTSYTSMFFVNLILILKLFDKSEFFVSLFVYFLYKKNLGFL